MVCTQRLATSLAQVYLMSATSSTRRRLAAVSVLAVELAATEPPHALGYRLMWMLVMFDLPVVEKAERKAATDFRNALLDMGFEMSQFSVYLRLCTSGTQVDTYCRLVQSALACWRQSEHPAVHRQAVRAHHQFPWPRQAGATENA